mgnify:FL=1
MSHRSRNRNLSEWADLVGASLPDSVEDPDGTGAPAEPYRGRDSADAFGADTDRSP